MVIVINNNAALNELTVMLIRNSSRQITAQLLISCPAVWLLYFYYYYSSEGMSLEASSITLSLSSVSFALLANSGMRLVDLL